MIAWNYLMQGSFCLQFGLLVLCYNPSRQVIRPDMVKWNNNNNNLKKGNGHSELFNTKSAPTSLWICARARVEDATNIDTVYCITLTVIYCIRNHQKTEANHTLDHLKVSSVSQLQTVILKTYKLLKQMWNNVLILCPLAVQWLSSKVQSLYPLESISTLSP